MKEELLDKLVSRRKELGLTQGFVADAIGLSQPQMSQRERGRATFPLEDFIRVAELCGYQVTLELADMSPVREATIRRIRRIVETVPEDQLWVLENTCQSLAATLMSRADASGVIEP